MGLCKMFYQIELGKMKMCIPALFQYLFLGLSQEITNESHRTRIFMVIFPVFTKSCNICSN